MCNKCDKKGHYAHECRTGKGKKHVEKKNVKCFNCDQVERYKNQCPEPVRTDRGKVFAIGTPFSSRPTTADKGKTMMEGVLLI